MDMARLLSNPTIPFIVHCKNLKTMKNTDKKSDTSKKHEPSNKKKDEEKKIDEQVKESFPASDPPSHVDPGSGRKEE